MFRSCELRAALLGTSILLASLATDAGADGFIINSGFEEDVLPLDTWVYRAHGWVITGDAGTFRPPVAAYPGGAPAGTNVGFVQSGWGRPTGVLEQTTSVILETGMTAHLEATIGRRVDNPLLPWGGYVMSLFAGDTLLCQDVTTVHPAAGSFVLASLSYTVDTEAAGAPLRIRLESLYGQTNIDDVRLTITPAPSAIATICLAAVYGCRRNRD